MKRTGSSSGPAETLLSGLLVDRDGPFDASADAPAFIWDWLLAVKGKRAAAENELRRLRPPPREREAWRNRLMRDGHLFVLDEFRGAVDLNRQVIWSQIPSLGISRARIAPSVTERTPAVLDGGVWAIARLQFEKDYVLGGERLPVLVADLEPIRTSVPDLRAVIEARELISDDGWLNLLIASLGFAPGALGDRRRKLLTLLRVAPLVEQNLNLTELGPQGTGKTYTIRNASPLAFVIAGGGVTPANLFVNLATRQLGIVATRHVVVFDEISSIRLADVSMIATFKDLMESGTFSRGNRSYNSSASFFFVGNIDVDQERPHRKYRHLFEPFPSEFQDPALIDRIHGYLPGWDLPKIRLESLSSGTVISADALAEIFGHLRTIDWAYRVRSELTYLPDMTRRDQRAVEKLCSSLLKLLYPHGKWNKAQLYDAATLAAEMRQRVHDQLAVMSPGQFLPRRIGFVEMPGF